MADEDGWGGGRRHDEAGLGRLLNEIKSLKRDVAELKRGAALRGAGIRVSPDGMIVNSSLDVQGDLSATGNTDIGGSLAVTGDAVISGPEGIRWTDSSGNDRIRAGRNTHDSGAEVNSLAYLDENGRQRVKLGQVSGESTGETLGHGLLVETAGGDDILAARDGRFYVRGDEHVWIESVADMTVTGGTSTWLLAEESVWIRADSGDVSLTAQNGIVSIAGGNSVFLTGALVGFHTPNGSGGWAVDVHSNGSRFNAVADNGFTLSTPNNSHRIQSVGNDIGVDAPNRLYVAADLHTTGDLSCAGTKPFIIDHPLHEDKSLVHVATESDRAVVEYHYRVTIGDDGSATIDLPDYFEALTAPDSRGVQVTPVGRPFMVGAEEPADGQVVVYGDPGRDAFVRVNARRGDDAGQFEVEIPRIQPPANTEEGALS